jgi:hypothetical protein
MGHFKSGLTPQAILLDSQGEQMVDLEIRYRAEK